MPADRRRTPKSSIRDAAAGAAAGAPKPTPRAGVPRMVPPPAPPPPEARWDAEASPAHDPNRTLGDWLEAVIPPEAQLHFINAGREFALGVQTTFDHHLGRHAAPPESGGAGRRIEIE